MAINMGMAGLLLEQLFNAPSFVDVSVALNDPNVYQKAQTTAASNGSLRLGPVSLYRIRDERTSSVTN